jgi:hypothetical protein
MLSEKAFLGWWTPPDASDAERAVVRYIDVRLNASCPLRFEALFDAGPYRLRHWKSRRESMPLTRLNEGYSVDLEGIAFGMLDP